LEGCYNIFLLGGTTNECWPILSFPMLLMDFRIFTFFRFIEKKHESKKKEKKKKVTYICGYDAIDTFNQTKEI
jgi:hypothetical protein